MIRKRILQYLDLKGISKYKFYKDNDVSNGFLDKEGSIRSDICEKISYQYEDINLTWLITGKGEMLLENQQSPTDTNSVISTDAKFEDLLVDLLSSPKAKKVINHLITERLNPVIDNLEAIDAYLAQQALDKLKGEE